MQQPTVIRETALGQGSCHAGDYFVVHETMITITQLDTGVAEQVPQTHALIVDTGLVLHDAVDYVTLHGSRGPQGKARPASDLDLCLIVSADALVAAANPKVLLRSVLVTTLQHWTGTVELDLATVFDKSHCGLRCLGESHFNPSLCPSTVDCMGMFKIQRGFDGFVTGPSVDCSKMYPLLRIWSKDGAQQDKSSARRKPRR